MQKLTALLLSAALWTACSSTPPAPVSGSSPPPQAVSTTPELAGTAPIPPRTRDPFEPKVGAPKAPPTQPLQRVGTNYTRPKRDPFVSTGGQRSEVSLAPRAADPDGGSHISKPARPDLKVLSIERQGKIFRAKISAQGQPMTVGEGQFVLGCRVTSIDSDGLTVTRAGVPFRLNK